MRLRRLILSDIRFQWKYGFYLLYAVLTALYIVVLCSLPSSVRGPIATLLIFSDPAAMGLFFMGAIVLLEKSQRVLSTFAVSPVRKAEYIVAKITALGVISSLVALVLAVAVGKKLLWVLAGTLCSSVIFSLLGIIVASKINSLNQFILWTVPFELVGFGPAIVYVYGVDHTAFSYYPANICVDMIAGRFTGIPKLGVLVLVIGMLAYLAHRSVAKMFQSLGGASL